MSGISPMILLVIVIIAVVFFALGLVHLLARCLTNNRPFSAASQSDGPPDAFRSQAFQRQLQQLFQMHDSGLDQAIVEALPVFQYKDIKGLKEPFDCAVCLTEFSNGDKLKLLVNCSHAFHIHCIETWLLSNCTCPVCRGHIGCEARVESHAPGFDGSVQQEKLLCPNEENVHRSPAKVFSVRLGKFISSNDGSESEVTNRNVGSSSTLDARRCSSMGAFQYIISDAKLQVTFCNENGDGTMSKSKCKNEKNALWSRGDSLSISKIWLWTNKGEFSRSSLGTNEGVTSSTLSRSHLV